MQDFRQLRVWQVAHRQTLAVYRATGGFPLEERYELRRQLRSSAASIAANIPEGCGRRTPREMAYFLQIACGSASELEYHLLLAHDLGFLDSVLYQALAATTIELKRMLSGLSRRVRGGLSGNRPPPSEPRSLTADN